MDFFGTSPISSSQIQSEIVVTGVEHSKELFTGMKTKLFLYILSHDRFDGSRRQKAVVKYIYIYIGDKKLSQKIPRGLAVPVLWCWTVLLGNPRGVPVYVVWYGTVVVSIDVRTQIKILEFDASAVSAGYLGYLHQLAVICK